jgi:hypothetical protein
LWLLADLAISAFLQDDRKAKIRHFDKGAAWVFLAVLA